MSIETQPYDSLPSLYDAGSTFDAINGNNFIKEVMKPLFRTYGIEHSLGLALMHSHFKLEDNERLTDIRGKSLAWTGPGGGPAVWQLDGNVLRPHEFSFDSHLETPDWGSEMYQQFLSAFGKVLVGVGAQNIFGLCSYPGDDFEGRVETTIGRANVNLKTSEADLFLPGRRRDAAWFFADELKDDSCKCTCVTNKDIDNHEHNGDHLVVG
ncbi:hypothetical protein VC83_06313 [Pseudogymnoascus destructans]|uniref:Uncharacterized protein n=2 Tax=Pseudogymnoascus destructans TaxID=655981 RepID=L8FN09_PSED2|nr:uncharacterized protein VC83_06313 [Pseudogymnoascus destructans]ELR01863.1 hypothetical protein GMDG_05050 [Pseudogymnoascus destructans 20631-21]OAF58871.1 hypothetical protein VC83_06313 [Pseudogymnoascus destructans]